MTTFVSGSNEYAVPDILSDHTDNYRGGLRFEFNRWHLTLEEGATRYGDDQQVYENQLNPGNRTIPPGGQPLSLSKLSQQYGITSDGLHRHLFGVALPKTSAIPPQNSELSTALRPRPRGARLGRRQARPRSATRDQLDR